MPPSVIVQLTKTPLLTSYDMSSVVACSTGAAPIKRETAVMFGNRVNQAAIVEGKPS